MSGVRETRHRAKSMEHRVKTGAKNIFSLCPMLYANAQARSKFLPGRIVGNSPKIPHESERKHFRTNSE